VRPRKQADQHGVPDAPHEQLDEVTRPPPGCHDPQGRTGHPGRADTAHAELFAGWRDAGIDGQVFAKTDVPAR
jgi:hypothetical protein